MRVYLCYEVDSYGELIYCKSFIDRAKARKWFLKTVEENFHGSLQSISAAVSAAEFEFDNYVPRLIDAESDVAIIKVIQTED